MPRRMGLRSSKTQHRSRSASPPKHANRDDSQQHTPPRPLRREKRKLPQRETPLTEDPPHRVYPSGSVIPDSQEDLPSQRYPSGSIIPDSQEDPTDLELPDADFDDEYQYLPDYSSTRVEIGYPSPELTDPEEEAVEDCDSLAVEVPDSQPLRAADSDTELDESAESFETVDTEIIPGGVRLAHVSIFADPVPCLLFHPHSLHPAHTSLMNHLPRYHRMSFLFSDPAPLIFATSFFHIV